MVAKLVKKFFKKQMKRQGGGYVAIMPDSFKLFFSSIFTEDAVLNHSNLQLMHPIFYNSDDRKRYVNAAMGLKRKNPSFFNANNYLYCSSYGLLQWHLQIPNSGSLRDVFNYNDVKYLANINCLLDYLRNLHEHFHEKDRV